MDAQDAAVFALIGYGVFLALAFGLRSLLHYWRTGASGYVGLSGRPGSSEWWGGVLFALAVVAAAADPWLSLPSWCHVLPCSTAMFAAAWAWHCARSVL